MDKNNIKISGCILTRNDNQLIKDCINNIIPYVDEIVILDANDDDITEDIIKNVSTSSSKPITYRRTTTSQNFAKDRNELQSMASGDYVIHVDCDEIFDTGLLSSMKNIISGYLNRDVLPILFRLPRINQPDRINYPDYQIRLLNRKYTIWKRSVHEVPEIIPVTKEEVGMKINNMVTLDYPITHLYKEKDEIQKRWKDLLQYSSRTKKLLIISIFKNSNIWMEKILRCTNELYRFNQRIDDNNRLDINISFIDQGSNDKTFDTLANYTKEGYILDVQLRNFSSENSAYCFSDKYIGYKILAKARNYAIEKSVTGFPISDDDYILFIDNNVGFNENVAHELIKDMERCNADIITPIIYVEGKDSNNFCDTIYFKPLDSIPSDNNTPYLLDKDAPGQNYKIGTFYIMKYKVAKNIKYNEDQQLEHIEFCNRARSQGFKVYVDPRLSVFHVWQE